MKRVLSFRRDYCPPSSTCCRHACSGCTPPCSAGSARTSWGWGLCLVLGFYQMGVLPNFFWPGILTRYIWFWDLNQMEDWPSYSYSYSYYCLMVKRGLGQTVGALEPFYRSPAASSTRGDPQGLIACPCPWTTIRGIHDDDDNHNEVVLILQRQ